MLPSQAISPEKAEDKQAPFFKGAKSQLCMFLNIYVVEVNVVRVVKPLLRCIAGVGFGLRRC